MIIRWSVVLGSWLQAKSIFLRFLFVFFSLPYIVRQAAWLFFKRTYWILQMANYVEITQSFTNSLIIKVLSFLDMCLR